MAGSGSKWGLNPIICGRSLDFTSQFVELLSDGNGTGCDVEDESSCVRR